MKTQLGNFAGGEEMYSKRTNFYQIPYMGYGDMLTEEDEGIQWTIVDNLLYAATFGVSKCILEEAGFTEYEHFLHKN